MKGRLKYIALAGVVAAGTIFLSIARPAAAAPGKPGMGTPWYIAQLNQQAQQNQQFQRTQQYLVNNFNMINRMLISQFQTEENTNVQMFTQLKNSYLQLANLWDQQGRDTQQLRTDLNTLQDKIDQLSSDYDQLVNQLNTWVNNGRQGPLSQGQIQPLVNQVNNDLQDIRNFLGQTVQRDLAALVSLQPTPTPTSSPTPTPMH